MTVNLERVMVCHVTQTIAHSYTNWMKNEDVLQYAMEVAHGNTTLT